jgi:serine/threonine protein kinase
LGVAVLDKDKFLKYKLIEKIGEGYFAETFKCLDEILEREVLLKIIKETSKISDKNIKVDYEKLMQLFLNESRTLQLSSLGFLNKHVPVIFDADFSKQENRFYFVQELIKGITLWDMIKNSNSLIDVSKVANYSLQLFEGLKDIHSLGIVHKDIKHDALILSNEGILKIIDFGLAEKIDYDKKMLGKSSVHFMPPERINEGIITKLSDVWSAGVVLYRLLSDNLPFKSVEEILNKDPKPIKLVRPDLPEYLEYVINSALQKDVSKRKSSKQLYDILKSENKYEKSFGVFDVYIENLKTSFFNELINNSLIIPDFSKLDLCFKEYEGNTRWWHKYDFDKAVNENRRKIVFAKDKNELRTLYLKYVVDFCEKNKKIPVFIDVSKSHEPDLEKEIINSVNALAKVEIEPSLIRDKIYNNGCVVIIDGVSENKNKDVVDDINRFLHKTRTNNLEVLIGLYDNSFDKNNFEDLNDLNLAPVDKDPSNLINKLIRKDLHSRFRILMKEDENFGKMAADFDLLRHTIDYFNKSRGEFDLTGLYDSVVSRILNDESRKTNLPASLIKKVLQKVSFDSYKKGIEHNIEQSDFEESLIDNVSGIINKNKYDSETISIKDKILVTNFIRYDKRSGYNLIGNLLNYFASLEMKEKIENNEIGFGDLDNLIIEGVSYRDAIRVRKKEISVDDVLKRTGKSLCLRKEVHAFNFLASSLDYPLKLINYVAKKSFRFSNRMISYSKGLPAEVSESIVKSYFKNLKFKINESDDFWDFYNLWYQEYGRLKMLDFSFFGKNLGSVLTETVKENDDFLLTNIPIMGYNNYDFQKFLISKHDFFKSRNEKTWFFLNLHCIFDEVFDNFIYKIHPEMQQSVKDASGNESLEKIVWGDGFIFGKMFKGISELRDRYNHVDKERTDKVISILDSDPYKESILNLLIEYDVYIPELEPFYKPKFESLANELRSGNRNYDLSLLESISESKPYSNLFKNYYDITDKQEKIKKEESSNEKIDRILSEIDILANEFNKMMDDSD